MRRVVFLSLLLAGCEGVDPVYSSSSYKGPATVSCYSAGVMVYEGTSTSGVIKTGDVWCFQDEGTGKFIRISADCVVIN